MTIREQLEERERKDLSPLACLSAESQGRMQPVEPCPVRTCFQRDTDRIVHSKAFRRLKHKTQVFLQPEGDHYRTRMTHTLEVARVARTIARGLGLQRIYTVGIQNDRVLGVCQNITHYGSCSVGAAEARSDERDIAGSDSAQCLFRGIQRQRAVLSRRERIGHGYIHLLGHHRPDRGRHLQRHKPGAGTHGRLGGQDRCP